jgi:hypothetical protein
VRTGTGTIRGFKGDPSMTVISLDPTEVLAGALRVNRDLLKSLMSGADHDPIPEAVRGENAAQKRISRVLRVPGEEGGDCAGSPGASGFPEILSR